MNKLQDTIEQIKTLEKELLVELQKQEEDFFYKIREGRVYFDAEVRKRHKAQAVGIIRYILGAKPINVVTMPVIWLCVIPAVLLDAVVSIYHAVCFRAYGIPMVVRSDYIVIDRQSLGYLNVIEKLNCIYCSYFNGLIAYVQEVAARTEQYWCPVKHARNLQAIHSRYQHFIEYGDAQRYSENLEKVRRDFHDLENNTNAHN
jgi:hypothetical protein